MTESRRTPGEGGAYSYQTKQGERWMWKATLTLADGSKKVTVRRGYTGKKKALDAMQEALGESKKGAYTEPSKMTLGEWIDEWLAAVRLTPNTEASYRNLIAWYIRPGLGAVPLAALTSSRIDTWMRNLERDGGRKGRPLKASTIGLALTVLSRILKDATEHEPPLLGANPCKKAHPPKVPRSGDAARMKAWSEAQAAAFLAWAREGDRRWADLWHLALMSGGRRNELLCLRWQDIDGRGITILHGKGGKVRHVPLDKGTLAMLRKRKAARGAVNLALVKPSALVFTTPAGDPVPLPNATQSFRYAVNRARRSLGADALPLISLHGTRHTMATIWLRAGVPVHTVSQRLGHASPVITMAVYAHVLQQEQDQHVDRVAERMAEGPPVPETSITEAPPEAAGEA